MNTLAVVVMRFTAIRRALLVIGDIPPAIAISFGVVALVFPVIMHMFQ